MRPQRPWDPAHVPPMKVFCTGGGVLADDTQPLPPQTEASGREKRPV